MYAKTYVYHLNYFRHRKFWIGETRIDMLIGGKLEIFTKNLKYSNMFCIYLNRITRDRLLPSSLIPSMKCTSEKISLSELAKASDDISVFLLLSRNFPVRRSSDSCKNSRKSHRYLLLWQILNKICVIIIFNILCIIYICEKYN